MSAARSTVGHRTERLVETKIWSRLTLRPDARSADAFLPGTGMSKAAQSKRYGGAGAKLLATA